MRRETHKTLALLLLAAIAPSAQAALERTGPVEPAHGYPAWYQDKSGLVLEFCNLTNADELAFRWCGLASPPPPAPPLVAPEVFPKAFSNEHYYWTGTSWFRVAGDNRNWASLVLGVQGAFASDVVLPGDQMTFGRLRIVVGRLPLDGTYHVYTPFGVYDFPDQKAGARLFFTEDIGATCPSGSFDCALATNVGPFLLPSAAPGGAELPPIPLLKPGTAAQPGPDPYYDALARSEAGPTPYPGDPGTQRPKYLADPARVGPVTGSRLAPFSTPIPGGPLDDCNVRPPAKRTNCGKRNHNIFRIEVEPADGSPLQLVGETYHFVVTGRLFEGEIASKVSVERVTYQTPVWDSSTAGQLDVFATAFPALQGRLPAGPKPAVVAPALHFFDEECQKDPLTGKAIGPPEPEHGDKPETTHQMFASGSRYWGQAPPCGAAMQVPDEVCVVHRNAVDASGKPAPAYYAVGVTDEVSVRSVHYDTDRKALQVKASSSDLLRSPTLILSGFGELVDGQQSLTRVSAPARVRVVSSKGGMDDLEMSTGPAIAKGPITPIAGNDMVRTGEDKAVAGINVLANDTLAGAALPARAVVTIVAQPRLGVAVVRPDNTIRYKPKANRHGTDGFAYRVTVDGVSSNVAGVSVLIAPVNDVPVAANDAAVTLQGYPVLIDVLANDTDEDGAGDMVSLVNLTPPAGVTVKAVDRGVSFVAAGAGTYPFTYQVQDSTGAVSAPATVSVTVHSVEVITVAPPALFRTDQSRWIISGSDVPVANQTLTITYADGPNAGFTLGSAIVDMLGNWAFDVHGASGLLNPASAGATQVVVAGPAGGRAVAPISVRP